MSTVYRSAILQEVLTGVQCLCAACGHLRPRYAVAPSAVHTVTRGKTDRHPIYLCIEGRTCRERAEAIGYGRYAP